MNDFGVAHLKICPCPTKLIHMKQDRLMHQMDSHQSQNGSPCFHDFAQPTKQNYQFIARLPHFDGIYIHAPSFTDHELALIN